MIPVLRPTIDDQTKEDLLAVLDSGWWGNGPKTAEFEKRFAEKVGAKYALGTSSGTAALNLCLRAHGMQGGELITTPMTFVADAAVGEWNGMEVTFADIEEDSLCLDPETVTITPQTQAIIVVNSHGRLANIKKLREKFKGLIVEDNAHAMFTPGVCQYSDIAMWSFNAVKNLPAGSGGMVTTDDEEVFQRLKALSWFGIKTNSYERSTAKKYNWDYDIETGNGIKAYMNDITATIALGQLRRIEALNAHRRAIQSKYNEAFREIPQITLPAHSHTVQYYTMRCADRNELGNYLATQGIASSLHFKPLSEMSYWKKAVKRPLPVTDRVWQEMLSLPVHGALSWEQVDLIINTVKEFYASK
ncbi:MAG: DegT/DnrJ/EryC1/StrS family aminotransferase [Planctomycetes bacterium]|nr:DegT/DnrJ/EryC1/StrS family aminotransferase [Planctomycetota bacterium]